MILKAKLSGVKKAALPTNTLGAEVRYYIFLLFFYQIHMIINKNISEPYFITKYIS